MDYLKQLRHGTLMLLLMVLMVNNSQSQTFSEWFRQKKTQKKYLLQQIAALETYIQYAQQGYRIAQRGLSTISSIKNGTFLLDQNYNQRWKNINPKVRNYGKLQQLLFWSDIILKNGKTTLHHITQLQAFPSEQLHYINTVFTRITKECRNTLEMLDPILTPDVLSLSDAERLQEIDKYYLQMKRHYTFFQYFQQACIRLAAGRISSTHDLQSLHDAL
ncbi:hypothetical protein ACG2LH_15295 [Zhouia sp. PK063]|uniref:hypothetical protein n=1 Tax=Zhouia sp. PK063 TaxID=3373602 RepID=UPI00378FCBF6